MDDYYSELDTEEITRLDLLSSDLNSIGLGSSTGGAFSSDWEIALGLSQVFHEDDPDKIRRFLDEPIGQDQSSAAFIRFLYWSKSQDTESAIPFAQYVVSRMEFEIVDIQERIARRLRSAAASNNDIAQLDEGEVQIEVEGVRRSEQHSQELHRLIKLVQEKVGELDDLHQYEGQSTGSGPNAVDPNDIQTMVNILAEFHSIRPAA